MTFYDGGIEFVGNGDGKLVIIKNSILWHISQISTHSHNTVMSNNTFYNCAKLQQSWGDNLTFVNNFIYNIARRYNEILWGNNATIETIMLRKAEVDFITELVGSMEMVLYQTTHLLTLLLSIQSLGSWGDSGNITWKGIHNAKC